MCDFSAYLNLFRTCVVGPDVEKKVVKSKEGRSGDGY